MNASIIQVSIENSDRRPPTLPTRNDSMTSPFRFKHPLRPQTQSFTPETPSNQLSARNFLLSHRPSSTSAASLPSGSPPTTDDIDDPCGADDLPRKRTRYLAFHDISSDEEDDNIPAHYPALETPIMKRPPVILPQPSPESPSMDFSPSRRQSFQPNGLAAYTARIIHEHSALSSVAVPRLDQEDSITVIESKMAVGGVGWICRVTSSQGTKTVLLLTPKGLSMTTQINNGDILSISNAVKLDTIWICATWHFPSQ
jgi:hypothetical protein